MRKYFWKLFPKSAREALLGRVSVVDRSPVDKILSDNMKLPRDFARHRCIFIHVPKCAGSSVKKALFPGRTHGHMPLWFYEKAFPEFFESAFKFSFVRNPLDRAYSAYCYLCSNDSVERDLAAHRMVTQFDGFDDFVDSWLCAENAVKQIHFAPQWHFLCDSLGRIRMDFIGRQESMDSDFRQICGTLGMGVGLDVVNASPFVATNREFDSRTVERIRQVYARDYRLLGY